MRYDVEVENRTHKEFRPVEADYFVIDNDHKTVRFYKAKPNRIMIMGSPVIETDELIAFFTNVVFVAPSEHL